jgi:hypothetical protein
VWKGIMYLNAIEGSTFVRFLSLNMIGWSDFPRRQNEVVTAM